MGAFTSRRNAGVEEVDIAASNAYRYPPKSGCYFGSYFIMGGERFDTTQPEAYLFGENQDLNFLGNRPVPFPYPAPQSNEPTKTLKSLINIRKDSLKFVKVQDEIVGNKDDKADGEAESEETTRYNIEFTFDTDVRVAITIFYFATEEISNGQAVYHPRDPSMNSETYHYKRGANQTFSQSTHILDPSKFPEEEWQFNPDKEVMPVVIQCVVEDEVDHNGHSHILFGVIEKGDVGFTLKPLKQKQMIDGLCYLLQEIYGIENKDTDRSKDEELDDSGSECVICMSDVRDTLILPCRHLCLCNTCADSLRYQANNCPICRAPFRALLQIRAMRKKLPLSAHQQIGQSDTEENAVSQEGVPAGYEAVSMIEALNGPTTTTTQQNTVRPPPDTRPASTNTPSLPTSPEDSPVMHKKKSKRQSSVRSQRSVVAAALVEEGEEAKEEDKEETDDGRTTPEVVTMGNVPEPVKESPKQKKKNEKGVIPKMRFSKKKKSVDENSEGDLSRKDSMEIVDELKQTKSKDMDGAIGGIESEPDQDKESHVQAHTEVMFSKDMADEGLVESEPLCGSLDGLTIPGTCSADESSYSSTNSGHTLLDPPSLNNSSGKPVV